MGPTLRASCDACNQSKVKCTKTRPHCARCAKHKTECIYGISLRAGKKAAHHNRGKVRQQQAQHQESAQTQPQQQQLTPQPAPKPESVDPSHFQHDWALGSPDSSSPYASIEMDMPPSMFEYEMPSRLDDYLLTQEPFPISHMATFSATSQSIDFAALSPSPPALSSSLLSMSAGSTAVTSPTSESSRLQSVSLDLFPVCSCYSSAIRMLHTLQQLSESMRTSFDVALNRNKEAVALCMATLKCQCAAESCVILLVGSLIAKIISIYERPCAVWKSVEHDPRTPDTIGSMSSRLRFGLYSVDESDEESLKTEIVRLELRKVQTLISSLKESIAKSIREPEQLMCEALVGYLSRKVQTANQTGNGFQMDMTP